MKDVVKYVYRVSFPQMGLKIFELTEKHLAFRFIESIFNEHGF